MPDIQDQLNVAERILNEKYEMNVLYIDDEGQLKEMEVGSLSANVIVERVANGVAKLKLTNIKVNGKGFSNIIKNYQSKIRIDIF